jgi:hypothetical protein
VATHHFQLVFLFSSLQLLCSTSSLLAGTVTNVERILPTESAFVNSVMAPPSDNCGCCISSQKQPTSLPAQPDRWKSPDDPSLTLGSNSSSLSLPRSFTEECDTLGQSGSDQQSPLPPLSPGGGKSQGAGAVPTTINPEQPAANFSLCFSPIQGVPSGFTLPSAHSLPDAISSGQFRPPRVA